MRVAEVDLKARVGDDNAQNIASIDGSAVSTASAAPQVSVTALVARATTGRPSRKLSTIGTQKPSWSEVHK